MPLLYPQLKREKMERMGIYQIWKRLLYSIYICVCIAIKEMFWLGVYKLFAFVNDVFSEMNEYI